MMRRQQLLQIVVVLCAVATLRAQQPDAAQIAQERRQAELDAPKLVEVLELKPGMTVADVGSDIRTAGNSPPGQPTFLALFRK